MIDLLHHLAAYGLWANKRFVERLAQEPAEVLDHPVPNSFPSLRTTVLHIRNAEHVWWCRLTGAAPRWPAEENDDIRTLLPHAQHFHDRVIAMGEKEAAMVHSYADLRGNRFQQPAWMMVAHCVNHSTQHRGQLITLMRHLQLQDIPANDMVVYQRSLM